MNDDISIVEDVYSDIAAKRLIRASDRLVDHLDRLLASSEIKRVQRILESLDVTKLPPPVLTGILSRTFHARTILGVSRTKFFEHCMTALETTWHVDAIRLAKIVERLK